MINIRKLIIFISIFMALGVGIETAHAATPKIVAGESHTVALKADGTLWAWGYNHYGQLGLGTVDGVAHPTPAQVGSASDWTAVAVGDRHTVALKVDGTLWAWGCNNYGQLSLSDGNIYWSDYIGHPNPVKMLEANSTWAAVAAAGNHSLALKTDGTLWAWGLNNWGQFGADWSDGNGHPVPSQVTGGTIWRTVIAGENHTLAIKTDGTLWAWGLNSNGMLGNGTVMSSNIPVSVIGSPPPAWGTLATGEVNTIAMKGDGTLWAWGFNAKGQLGIDSADADDHPIPVQIGTEFNWSSVAGGYMHNLATKKDGTLWAWGMNDYGQLGIGSKDNDAHSTTTQIGDDADWITVAAGGFHSVAMKEDGSLWAWGQNTYGQLGNGNTTTQTSPVQIMNLLQNSLMVNKTGTGVGTVTGSGVYNYGTTRQVSATAGTGSTFMGWSGHCSGTDNSTDVLIDGNKSCTATFTLNQHTLTVNKVGTGTGTVTGSGTYSYGMNRQVSATAGTGSTFSGWSGDCSGLASLVNVLIDNDKSCTATFTLKQHILTVTTTGTGTGAISGSGTYDYGTTQQARATANTGSTFTGWSGDCTGTTNPQDVLINRDKTCRAVFTLNQYALSVIKTGTGKGTVTGSGTYNYGTTQVVNAIADTGSTFTGWTGDCTGLTSPLNVLITGNKTCSATFNLPYVVNPSATGSGAIIPSSAQSVKPGLAAQFTLSPGRDLDNIEVFGSCPQGILSNNGDGTWQYTTGVIEGDCTVIAVFGLLGDVNRDGFLNLSDTIYSLQVVTGIIPAETIVTDNDINGDGKVGLEEVIYSLKKVAGN